MLSPTLDMLVAAQENAYAIGAFNVYNLEGVKAVIEAAEAVRSPVMLQILPKALDYGGSPLIALCLEAARSATVPVAVHLDHSSSGHAIRAALAAGLPSIMADGSHLDYNANVAFTRDMVTMAHAQNAAVEAELGRISGTEDGLTVADIEARMTDPQQAADFVQKTKLDALAVCIGNVHGTYPTEPHLDFDRLAAIRRAVTIPLVLHGTSGLSDALIRQSIALGICKFNVNTEMRHAYVGAMRRHLAANIETDLLNVLQPAIEAMRAVVIGKLQLFRSDQKAI